MADSDDEYDRKRRDKFRGERSAGGGENYRSERRDERRREDWPERNPFRGGRARPDYREYRGGGRDRYSPGRELPPQKRMRPDWGDDARPRYGGHDGYGMYGWGHEHYPMHGGHGFGGPPMPHNRGGLGIGGGLGGGGVGGGGGGGGGIGGGGDPLSNDLQTQPPMLTLKHFLDTQDDGISDADVLQKYREYKLDFKRQQLNEFFVAHKDEEWFKNKYHPEESLKRKEEQLGFLNHRVEVFSELLDQGSITAVSVDTNQSEPLLRLLDTVVIKLEGGTEEDLKALDEKVPDIKIFETRPAGSKTIIDDDDVIITDVNEKTNEMDNEKKLPVIEISAKPIGLTEDDENWDDSDDDGSKRNIKKETKTAQSNDMKRKRSVSDSSSSGASTSSDESKKDSFGNGKDHSKKNLPDIVKDDDDEMKSIFDDESQNDVLRTAATSATGIKSELNKEDKDDKEKNEKSAAIKDEENGEESKDGDDDIKSKQKKADSEIVDGDDDDDDDDEEGEQKMEVNSASAENDKDKQPETIDLDKEKDMESPIIDIVQGPRALHRTSSIFLRNLAPTITKSEIEAVCKRYDGFLRVAIADPLVERRWFRRGWVTLKRHVNIKEICWNLNNIRLRDCEMGAIVNRDLSRRVRPVNGITAHKTIVRNDIKLCAKIVMNLDDKFNLWLNKMLDAQPKNDNESFGFKSNNPVLQNITDFLIEEASAEEDELLGLSSSDNKDGVDGETLDRDPQLVTVLDKLILYLRVVHSVDFYNHCEYPYEDEMPNRCGIIHARGPPPQNKITNTDIQDYTKNFDGKMASFLAKSSPIDLEELKNLGCKDPEAEVEKFVQANTQELAKDKWLCPLSGKKFKGPEFIRKHIFNKHGEKVDEVRKEVDYFNNYLKDPKRPQLPEHPGNTKRQPPPDMGSHAPYRPGGYGMGGYAPPYAAYAPPMIAPTRGNRGFGGGGGGGRRGPGGDFRPIIHYRDLDAPREPVDLL